MVAYALRLAADLQRSRAQENAWPSIRTDAHGTVPGAGRETFSAIRQALADGWFRPSVSYWPDVTLALTQAS